MLGNVFVIRDLVVNEIDIVFMGEDRYELMRYDSSRWCYGIS